MSFPGSIRHTSLRASYPRLVDEEIDNNRELEGKEVNVEIEDLSLLVLN